MTRPDQTRPDQTRPDQTNYDFLYDKEYYIKNIHTESLINKKLSYRVVENCTVLPYIEGVNEGGLFDSNGNYIIGSSFRDGGVWDIDAGNTICTKLSCVAENIGFSLEDIPFRNETVIHTGVLMGVWGHFITDSLRLLWFLNTLDYREKFSQCQLICLQGSSFAARYSENHRRLLEILGVNTLMLVQITEPTKYERVILPDECFFMSKNRKYATATQRKHFFTSEYVGIIDSVRAFAGRNTENFTPERIYYSYSSYAGGKTFGEDKLERYFASKGYEIVHPESLSIDEQLIMLAGCRSFASTIGSCSHNIIFLPDNAEAILIPRSYYLNGYQSALDQVHNLNITYIDSSLSIFAGAKLYAGPHLYYISKNLRKYFHDEDTSPMIDASDFMKYMNAFPPADSPEAYMYYCPVAAEYFSHLFHIMKERSIREKLKGIPMLRAAVRAVKKMLRLIR